MKKMAYAKRALHTIWWILVWLLVLLLMYCVQSAKLTDSNFMECFYNGTKEAKAPLNIFKFLQIIGIFLYVEPRRPESTLMEQSWFVSVSALLCFLMIKFIKHFRKRFKSYFSSSFFGSTEESIMPMAVWISNVIKYNNFWCFTDVFDSESHQMRFKIKLRK